MKANYTVSLENFWIKVWVLGKQDCWNWTGAKDSEGYGQFGWSGKVIRAHRVSWEIHNGLIPEGMCVLHKCDNPRCVNPEHLFLGTHTDNMRDAKKKGRLRTPRGEKHANSKLTRKQVLSIRKDYKSGGVTQTKLAKKHGVSQATTQRIITRKAWSHL